MTTLQCIATELLMVHGMRVRLHSTDSPGRPIDVRSWRLLLMRPLECVRSPTIAKISDMSCGRRGRMELWPKDKWRDKDLPFGATGTCERPKGLPTTGKQRDTGQGPTIASYKTAEQTNRRFLHPPSSAPRSNLILANASFCQMLCPATQAREQDATGCNSKHPVGMPYHAVVQQPLPFASCASVLPLQGARNLNRLIGEEDTPKGFS